MAKDKYNRRPSFRPLKDKVLIMCGGEIEEIYFNDFKHKHKKHLC